MNQEAYNALITKTFCDNAIRTVMLIDDQYVPYASLVKTTTDATDLEDLQASLELSSRAAEIQNYFENKKLICDVSDGFTNFDAEKARKSDLIILDYFLENNEPVKTISILDELAHSNHLNLVVLYTNKSLDDSWLQVVSSLRGCGKVDLEDLIANEENFEFWEDETESGEKIPESWLNTIDEHDVASFLMGLKPDKNTIGKIIKAIGAENSSKRQAVYIGLCHHRIVQGKLDLLNKQETYDGEFCGCFGDSKWLKIGNLFLCFSHKEQDDTGEKINQKLNDALINWSPNYFRLILSEIENQLENEGVSISSFDQNNYLDQAAWLWQILSESSKLDVSDLVSQNNLTVREKLLSNKTLISFATSVLDCIKTEFPQLHEIEQQRDDQSDDDYATYKKATLSKNVEITNEQIRKSISVTSSNLSAQPSDVVVAINKSLSLKEISTPHITTGSILTNESKDEWYVCVSPACDCVPEQNNTDLTRRLSPNYKPLKFLELTKVKQGSALKKATQGKYLFLPGEVFLQIEGEPKLDYVISSNSSKALNTFDVYFLDSDEENVTTSPKILTIYSQLKEEYSARFQAIASHHVGRIGVDFVNYEG